MKRVFYSLLLFYSALLCTSLEQESGTNATSFADANKTSLDTPIFELEALLDYESGLVFYKDHFIPACLVERIPYSILEESGSKSAPTFTIPIPSKEICLGDDSKVLPTDPAFISEPGLLFCSGLPILDINKLTSKDEEDSFDANSNDEHARRKRQSNGYYRTTGHAPTGEARAQSNWNNPTAQASQAQVQGQVFGSGFFSGQAQSQNGGMSQSQVQLSGVGIRGQIASSSGNAQAQLSLGNGAGSGQAGGLGEGPSSSQVQVSLGQQGEESMASASATSGGVHAGVGGPGAAATTNQYGGGGTRAGTAPYGYTPGTRLFGESLSGGPSQQHYGNGAGYGVGGSQFPGTTGQYGAGQGLHAGGVPGTGQQYLGGSGSGTSNGLGGSQFTPGAGGYPNGQGGGSGVHGAGAGRSHGATNGLGAGVGADRSHGTTNGLGVGSGTGYTPGQGVPSGTFGQGLGGTGGSGLQGGTHGGGESGRFVPGLHGTGGLAGSQSGQSVPVGISGQPYGQSGGGGGSGIYPGTNGNYRSTTAGVPGQGTGGGNGRYVSGSNGGSYYTNGGTRGQAGAQGGGPYAHSSTPGAYASTYGQGQAQAQTVYFGNAGNGHYTPVRYDQASQPGAPGLNRFQDQNVGVGSAGQRQLYGGGSGTYGGSNGHHHTLRNGHTSYGYGNGALTHSATTGQQPLGNGASSIGAAQQPFVGSSGVGGATGPQGSVVPGSGTGPLGSIPTQQSGHTTSSRGESDLGGSVSQPSGYSNGVGGRPQQQTHLSPAGYVPGSSGYPGIGGSTSPTATNGNGRTGQTHYGTNGYGSGGHSQQQVPLSSRNGHSYRNGHSRTTTAESQDGFSPSYGISRPSPEDPEGRKCTIITFSCTIVIESNGRAKVCRPNAVTMNGNSGSGSSGTGGGNGSKICCC